MWCWFDHWLWNYVLILPVFLKKKTIDFIIKKWANNNQFSKQKKKIHFSGLILPPCEMEDDFGPGSVGFFFSSPPSRHTKYLLCQLDFEADHYLSCSLRVSIRVSKLAGIFWRRAQSLHTGNSILYIAINQD